MRARVVSEAVFNGEIEPPTVETPFGTVRCTLHGAPSDGAWGTAEWTVHGQIHPEPAEGAPAVWELEGRIGTTVRCLVPRASVSLTFHAD